MGDGCAVKPIPRCPVISPDIVYALLNACQITSAETDETPIAIVSHCPSTILFHEKWLRIKTATNPATTTQDANVLSVTSPQMPSFKVFINRRIKGGRIA